MISIIDYGAGNIYSVKNALDHLGYANAVVDRPEEIEDAERIIFPGVGSFGSAMGTLKDQGLIRPIRHFIESGRPFLGICLGLQLLFCESEESPGVPGLSIVDGKVVRFRKGKVPQIGWNKVVPNKESKLKEGHAYFVNSYHVLPEDDSIIAMQSDYHVAFCSAISKGNILAVQFHPEKSGPYGLELLRRWSSC